jgi:outer membrane protein
MLLRCVLLLALGVGLAAPACAQPISADTVVVTLDEALRRALADDLSLARLDLQGRQQELAVEATRVQRRPTISVGGGSGQSFGRSIRELAIVSEPSTSFNMGASASLMLYDGGIGALEEAQARAGLAAVGYNRERLAQTVVFNVVTAYLTALLRQQNVDLQRQALADQRETLARVVGLIEGGARPQADRYPIEADVAQAEYAVATAVRDGEQAELDLIRLLRLDPRVRYRFVVPPVEAAEAGTPAEAAALALLDRALEARTDLRALDAELRVAEQGVRLAGRGIRPRVSASFQYGTAAYTTCDASFDPTTGQVVQRVTPFFEQLDQRRGGSFGINVSLPLFDGGQTALARARARVAVDNARLAIEERRQEVATQVRQALLDLRATQEQVRTSTIGVEAARRAVQAAEDRYRFGIATVYDLTQARSALLRAESALLQARYQLLAQRRILDYQVGTLDPETLLPAR